jgi:hypothetical protein
MYGSTPAVSNDREPFGINLYGHISGNFGLAVAARNTLHALMENDVDTCVIDIYGGARRSGHDRSFASLACDRPSGRYPVSLFHTNPPNMYRYAIETSSTTWEPDRLRVLVPFWELPRFPEGVWTDFVSSMDLVLAPTRFVAETVTRCCPDTPVIHYPQAVFLPEGIAPARHRLGLPETAFTCLTVMDAGSGFERKNPMGSVAAFREAFADLGPDEVRLVVKMTSRRDARNFSSQIETFRSEVEDDPRITVIEESMSYADVLSLNASTDVLISLHRAEGLGLNLMEAMSLGTVVLGTGWSGNMDFMTPENSMVVDYSEAQVRSEHEAYSPESIGGGQYWAEPDIHDAATRLRRLYDDRALLVALATQAREDMEAARTTFLESEWLSTLREMHAADTIGSAAHARRTGSFLSVMRAPRERPTVRMLRHLKRLAARVLYRH